MIVHVTQRNVIEKFSTDNKIRRIADKISWARQTQISVLYMIE